MTTDTSWTKLMMLVMEYFQLQIELTTSRIEEFESWFPESLGTDEPLTQTGGNVDQRGEDVAQFGQKFSECFQEDWA
ncbi:MAG: hypothetical protein DWC07_07045 [Candidatus Poseidoniales archaeon]|nr:MAG: hypothetical protein DWC07_07045 [Candidatus Poseidoniales archaeon]